MGIRMDIKNRVNEILAGQDCYLRSRQIDAVITAISEELEQMWKEISRKEEKKHA